MQFKRRVSALFLIISAFFLKLCFLSFSLSLLLFVCKEKKTQIWIAQKKRQLATNLQPKQSSLMDCAKCTCALEIKTSLNKPPQLFNCHSPAQKSTLFRHTQTQKKLILKDSKPHKASTIFYSDVATFSTFTFFQFRSLAKFKFRYFRLGAPHFFSFQLASFQVETCQKYSWLLSFCFSFFARGAYRQKSQIQFWRSRCF